MTKPPDPRGRVALVLAATLFASFVIMGIGGIVAAFRDTGFDTASATMMATILGALIGALAVFLNGPKDDDPDDDPRADDEENP